MKNFSDLKNYYDFNKCHIDREDVLFGSKVSVIVDNTTEISLEGIISVFKFDNGESVVFKADAPLPMEWTRNG